MTTILKPQSMMEALNCDQGCTEMPEEGWAACLLYAHEAPGLFSKLTGLPPYKKQWVLYTGLVLHSQMILSPDSGPGAGYGGKIIGNACWVSISENNLILIKEHMPTIKESLEEKGWECVLRLLERKWRPRARCGRSDTTLLGRTLRPRWA